MWKKIKEFLKKYQALAVLAAVVVLIVIAKIGSSLICGDGSVVRALERLSKKTKEELEKEKKKNEKDHNDTLDANPFGK